MMNVTIKVLLVMVSALAAGCAVGDDGSTEEAVSEVSGKRCHLNDPAYDYVGTSKRECQVIRFYCPDPAVYFADNCGCGCYTEPQCPIIDCAAPPDGCHYEGAVFTPCEAQTCGTLVCPDDF